MCGCSVRSRNASLQKSHSHVFTDDDSNMSWTSSSSTGRRKPRHLHRPHSPSMDAQEATGPITTHERGSSDSEEGSDGEEGEEQEKPRKVGGEGSDGAEGEEQEKPRKVGGCLAGFHTEVGHLRVPQNFRKLI